ncbi:hypothetical protein [Desulfocucumis palustris]|uniref:hypothetical protein n=1 Tax=Desulfocucumis palustris TaxID=1898651 RepID=UPI000CEA39E9|nr:hypothetical protein [Desulfocucumis palustris]
MEPEYLIKALRDTDSYIEMIYLNGGCYRFYKFLKSIFPKAEPYINPRKDHVVTKIGDNFYDIRGKADGMFLPLLEQDIKMCEEWSFARNNWLYRECPLCNEPIIA